MVCHSPHSLSNLQSHTLALFRLFAGAPAEWVMGEMDDDEQAAADRDLSGSGYIAYANGVRGFMNSRADRSGQGWTLEFIGERGMIVSRNGPRAIRAVGVAPRRPASRSSGHSPTRGIRARPWSMRLRASVGRLRRGKSEFARGNWARGPGNCHWLARVASAGQWAGGFAAGGSGRCGWAAGLFSA